MQIFITNHQDIAGRLDCDYYQPEYVKLEKLIAKKTNKTLDDYVLNIAGGATPNKKFTDKYYTESADNGIPFLRVQNVTKEGLNFNNCKYINRETHQGLLKRSQVREDYLITKITGVGRMAISSVAPKGFEGNINQHLVAIKTENRKISRELATFLNSDIGEKLASRRSTGGTRPALDYKALQSIPVVLNSKIVSIMLSTYKTRGEKLKQADKLLNSIDGYIKEKLGIKYTEPKEEKIYTVNAQVLEHGRHDPNHYNPTFERMLKVIESGKYKTAKLGKVLNKVNRSFNPSLKTEYDYVQLGFVEIETGIIKKYRTISLPKIPARATQIVGKNEILFSLSAPQMGNHFVAFPKNNTAVVSSGFVIFNSNENNSYFFTQLLKNKIYKKLYRKYLTGAGLFQTILISDLLNLPVPLPPVNIQNKIGGEIQSRIKRAISLRNQADSILAKAKKKVGQMILN